MKTTKIITALVTLNLVLFVSIASIAKPFITNTNDEVKTTVVEKVSSGATDNDLNYLRFDVNKFTRNSEMVELPVNPLNQLFFDVSKFMDATGINELPSATEFNYLRFDVNAYFQNTTDDLNEMPANEFNYLRFDVNKFFGSEVIDELPSN